MSGNALQNTKEALIAAGITGPHKSHSRKNAISKIHSIIEGDTHDTFGISGLSEFSAQEILSFVAELMGCSDDLSNEGGYDDIDPDLTIAGIVEAGHVLRSFAERGASMLIATGHPTGMLEHNIRVADAYQRAGGKIVTPREEELIVSRKGRNLEVRYTGGVGCLADWGALLHTHSSDAMEALLEAEPWPDLVFGDHGWAGAAIERGIPTIAIIDINDPALAVAWSRTRDKGGGGNGVMWAVPLDDNRPPGLYEPAWTLFEALLRNEAPDA